MISQQEEIELIEAIKNLNEEIYNQYDHDTELALRYETDGFYSGIEWLGMSIWNSEDDDRNIEDNDNYESWEEHLSRKMNNWVQKFNKLKI